MEIVDAHHVEETVGTDTVMVAAHPSESMPKEFLTLL
jgi:hypothetical protein